MKVTMKKFETGDARELKVGWSWVLFFFSGFLGIPLFRRKLNLWGGIMLFVSLVLIVSSVTTSEIVAKGAMMTDADLNLLMTMGALRLLFSGIMSVLSIFLAIKGNKMTALALIKRGWTFASAQSDSAKFAKMKWNMAA